jgi:hypothetical protein
MGSLSNLYISQSYQSLIHLATNNTASATLIGLQDGLGNSIGVSVNTGGNLYLSGSLSASLQQGFTYVGNAAGRTTLVATSSFGGATPAGTISSSAQITALGFVSSSVTASSLVTASFSGNTLTFTKGDSSTFGVVIPDISGSTFDTGSFVNTSSFNQYTSSTNNRLNNLESTSASVNISISNLNSTTASQVISISNLNAYTQSNDAKWNTLGGQTGSYVTSAITASSLVTASVNLNTITFTKGDASTFAITVNTGSGGGSTDITSLNAFTQSILGTNPWTASIDQKFATIGGQSGSWGGGGGAISVQDEGTILGNATSFNFNGAGVTATLSSGTASITIPGGGGTINTGSFLTTGSLAFGGSTNKGNGIYQFNIATGSAGYAIELFNTGSDIIYGGTGSMRFGITDPGNPFIQMKGQTWFQFGTGNELQFAAFTSSYDNGVIIGPYYTSAEKVRLMPRSSSLQFSQNVGSGDVPIFTLGTQNGVSQSIFERDLRVKGQFTSSLQQGFTYVGNASGISTLVATSSFGGGGTTYINPTLNPYSGSLILVANTFTSSSFAHISASANGQVNLVFKNNNNTGDTILSGSNNLFVNPAAATVGFKRYMGGSGNIVLNASSFPQISSSMAFSPTMNNNYFGGNATDTRFRGPVSSSAWSISHNISVGTINIGSTAALHAEKLVSGLTMTGNSIGGTLTIVANQSALTGSTTTITNNNINGTVTLNLSSSALTFTGNTINDTGFTLTNQFSSSSVGLGLPTANANTIAGANNTFLMTGSQLTSSLNFGTSFNQNFIFGNTNTLFSNASNARVSGSNNYAAALATGLLGQRLIVTGSSSPQDVATFGSVFVGRNNADDGRRNKTSDIVFAVGTGISSSADTRKTGFLIDSGSNTFVEGTFNVSGSTSLTGSLSIHSGSALPSATGSSVLTWNATTGQVGQVSFNTLLSASLSVGEFYNSTTLSGSAGVSQSVYLPTTGVSNGLSIQNNSQIVTTQTGTYNIQFSAQCDAFGGADTIWIWFKKNGVNIADSASKLIMQNNTAAIMTVNIFDNATAGDYYEIVWQNNGGTGILVADAATGNIPAVPSVIVTVNEIR